MQKCELLYNQSPGHYAYLQPHQWSVVYGRPLDNLSERLIRLFYVSWSFNFPCWSNYLYCIDTAKRSCILEIHFVGKLLSFLVFVNWIAAKCLYRSKVEMEAAWPSTCEIHTGRTIEYFCEDDKVAICSYCVVMGDHKNHKITTCDEKVICNAVDSFWLDFVFFVKCFTILYVMFIQCLNCAHSINTTLWLCRLLFGQKLSGVFVKVCQEFSCVNFLLDIRDFFF